MAQTPMEKSEVRAILKTGGKQFLVREGDTIRIERYSGGLGSTAVFNEVLALLRPEGEIISLGNPRCDARVEGTLLEEKKGKKILVQKFKSKTRYRRKRGHRQIYTTVKIEKIIFVS